MPWILNCELYACLTDETNFLSRCKIGDMRFLSQEFSETRSTCSGSWLPLYRTVEETLFVNHILHITCKIFSKSRNVYQHTLFVLNCYRNIPVHFLTVREYNRTIFLFFIVQVMGSTTLKDNNDLGLQAWWILFLLGS